MTRELEARIDALSLMLRGMARRLSEERRELRQDVQDHVDMLNIEDLVFERRKRFEAERERDELKNRMDESGTV
jgi:hemerythrin superfamily protein